MSELVSFGIIEELNPIDNADFIVSATVTCGPGKWKGIVRKDQFHIGDTCIVYLPDALIPVNDKMLFMKASGWRVKMRRFKGSPSEVVIMPNNSDLPFDSVTKYEKPVPGFLQGQAIGYFPGFIPKTDEPNYQSNLDLVQSLVGKPYYITEKMDGTSTTIYKKSGELHVCSRNLELKRDETIANWKIALKYKLDELLPEGVALQLELCGPGIQSNPMGLKEIDGFAFSAYAFKHHSYLNMRDFRDLLDYLKFPSPKLEACGECFALDGLELLGEGKYANGKQREGVVVRSKDVFFGKPISFKVINLSYDK